MDGLKKSHVLDLLSGRVYFTHFDAVASINLELAKKTLAAHTTIEHTNP